LVVFSGPRPPQPPPSGFIAPEIESMIAYLATLS
jgi:hypothetical protein